MLITQTEAAVLRRANEPLTVETVDVEQPRDDEVLVRMVGVGVCHTDLGVIATAVDEQLPVVLGHEGSGVVEAVGAKVRNLEPGDHVVLTFNYCGRCDHCERGLQVHCRDFVGINLTGARADGSSPVSVAGDSVFGHFFGQSSFARQAITTERNAIKIDSDLPLEILGPLGCGVQTGAGTVLNTGGTGEGRQHRDLRRGFGGARRTSRCRGVRLRAYHRDRSSRVPPPASCVSRSNAHHRPQHRGRRRARPRDHRRTWCQVLRRRHRSRTSGQVRAGVPSVTGRLRQCRLPGSEQRAGDDQGHLLFGRSLVGVIEGDAIPAEFIPRMLSLCREGRFPFNKLVETYAFDDINAAIDDVHHGSDGQGGPYFLRLGGPLPGEEREDACLDPTARGGRSYRALPGGRRRTSPVPCCCRRRLDLQLRPLRRRPRKFRWTETLQATVDLRDTHSGGTR